MKIKAIHRRKLEYYLKEFYKKYPQENFTIFHLVKSMKRRLKDNKDAWMAVSGDTGTGKSYFVIMAQMLLGRPYSLTENITYIPKGNEIIEKFDKLSFQGLLVDEAAKEMRAVNWQSKQQQNVNVKAMTDRFKNNWVCLNMPNFNEFTKSMRRGNVLFRAILPYRTDHYARVIIQRRSRNWRSEDPWGDELANKMYEKAEKKYKEIDNDTILRIERAIPNTIMDFIVPNLSKILPDVTSEYERLKIESRKEEVDNEPEMRVNRYKAMYSEVMAKVANILVNNTLHLGQMKVTKKAIAEQLGIAPDTLTKHLNKYEVLKAKEADGKGNFRRSEQIDKK